MRGHFTGLPAVAIIAQSIFDAVPHLYSIHRCQLWGEGDRDSLLLSECKVREKFVTIPLIINHLESDRQCKLAGHC